MMHHVSNLIYDPLLRLIYGFDLCDLSPSPYVANQGHDHPRCVDPVTC